MVYQQHFLVPSLSVLSNVLSGALGKWSTLASVRNYIRPDKRFVEQAAEVLSSVGLANRINDRVSELSGGQQQRVAIARMLMQDPTVMLADEPISSLDPSLAEETIELLRTLARTSSRTLILSTHNVELALRSSARVIFLSHGRLIIDSLTSSLDRQNLKEIYKLASSRQEPLAWKPVEQSRSRKQCVC
jgi:phosphonate transport system ATP-binding protein